MAAPPAVTDPDVWGPPTWRAVHHIALGYPERAGPAEAAAYRAFFAALGPVLPCGTCADNYRRHVEHELPLTERALAGRDALFAWTVALHNLVNRETGKRELSLPEARREYSHPPSPQRATERAGAVLAGLAAGLSLTGAAALVWFLVARRARVRSSTRIGSAK